jgi:hypothetical protein
LYRAAPTWSIGHGRVRGIKSGKCVYQLHEPGVPRPEGQLESIETRYVDVNSAAVQVSEVLSGPVHDRSLEMPQLVLGSQTTIIDQTSTLQTDLRSGDVAPREEAGRVMGCQANAREGIPGSTGPTVDAETLDVERLHLLLHTGLHIRCRWSRIR